MRLDLEELAENLDAIALMLETRCRTAADPLAVVDTMAEELRVWAKAIHMEIESD